MGKALPKHLPQVHKTVLKELRLRAEDERMPQEFRAWCHAAAGLLIAGDMEYEQAIADAKAKGITLDAFGGYMEAEG